MSDEKKDVGQKLRERKNTKDTRYNFKYKVKTSFQITVISFQLIGKN